MRIPRLSWNAKYGCFIDDDGIELNDYEVVSRYNTLVERHEILLDDIEEIIGGNHQGTDRTVHTGFADNPQRAIDTA